MSRKTVFHVLEFEPSRRASYVFSDVSKISVIRRRGWVALTEQSNGSYSTDADLTVRSAIYNPNAVRAWRMIMPVVWHKTELGIPLTLAQFRLFDGTDELYWDGGAWAVAGAGQWTSMTDLQANFASFSSPTNEIALVTNLASVDGRYTPELVRIVICLDLEIKSWVDEYIYRGIKRKLEEYLKPGQDWSLIWPGGTTYDMSDYAAEDGTIIDDIVEASLSPDYDVDILSSYDPGAKTLELTQSVAADERVYVKVVPDILFAVATHVDWYQPSRIPAVVFRHYRKLFAGESPAREYTANYQTLQAIAAKSPRRHDVDIPVDVLGDRTSFIPIVTELIQEYVRRYPIMVTPGGGFEARLEVEENTQFFPRGEEASVQRGVIRLWLRNCQEWYEAATDEHVIETMSQTLVPS